MASPAVLNVNNAIIAQSNNLTNEVWLPEKVKKNKINTSMDLYVLSMCDIRSWRTVLGIFVVRGALYFLL